MIQPTLVSAQPPAPKKGLSTVVIVLIVVGVLGFIGVAAVGVLAALGIYGAKRYISAAKTAEAKNNVAAISRAAVAAYEREGARGGHALCASRGLAAPGHGPVPQDFHYVQGTKYQPGNASGADFNTGSEAGGWRCLKFTLSAPMYYQLHYVAGGPWVTKNGATAGPAGFEAAAKGDINGDGTPSFFSRTGSVASGAVQLQTTLFVENEFE